MRPLFCVSLLVLVLAPTFAADVESVDCDSLDGWTVIDGTGGAGHPELSLGQPREGAASVRLRFERVAGGACALVHTGLLTGLRRLRMEVRVERTSMLLISVTDRDQARFHHTVPVEAGGWRTVSIGPEAFRIADDSPVKKDRLDPSRLGVGFGLLDVGGILGETGTNSLDVDSLSIDRGELPDAALPASVEGRTVEIAASGRHDGDVAVRAGGTLRITAARFVLAGSVTLEGGTLEIAGGAFTLDSRFSHQRTIDLGKGAKLVVRDAILANRFNPMFEVRSGATLEFDRMMPAGCGTSTSVHEGGSVSVKRSTWPGEFMLFPGARVAFEQVSRPLLWVTLGDNARGRVSLPDGKRIEDWRLDPAMRIDLSLRACDDVMWGLISAPGSDVVVADTRFATAGITLWGQDRIVGLRNGEAGMTQRLALTDRKLELSRCSVEVWNVYAAPNSKVTLEGCRLGEIWSFGNADLTLVDSECDGRGGYVKAQDESTFRLVGCTLDAEVIAQGTARMRLERCTLKRNLSASDAAHVTLAGTRVLGSVQRIGAGRVEEGE